MNIKELKSKFITELREEYPEQEILSFFNILTEKILGMTRLDVAMEPQREISENEKITFEDALQRLKQHEPIQYIIGETEFFGLKFKVNKNVLVPRPETEELVEWIIFDFKNYTEKELKILDIGTGSGCISISLAKNLPNASVSAMDISAEALKTAKENAEVNKVEINFIQQDVLQLENLPERYDIIVSNPPYVRELEKKEMQQNVLKHEPETALYVKDENPLLFYDKITRLAKTGLKENGALYFEINQYLGAETAEFLRQNNFSSSLKKDIFGNDRMLKGIFQNQKNEN